MMKRESKTKRSAQPARAPGKAAESIVLCGRKSILELAGQRPQALRKIFFREGVKLSEELASALEKLEESGIPVERCSAEQLEKLAPDDHHQGLAAILVPLGPLQLSELSRRSLTRNKLLIALDEIQDSRNFGAILRTVDAAGADGVVYCQSHSAGLSATARRVSAGASEFVRCAAVPNLGQALLKLKEQGFWIAGTWIGPESKSIFDVELPEPLVLVLGAEEKGLRQRTRSLCDFLIEIPMAGHVQSLNVSQAAAVALFEIQRRRRQHSPGEKLPD
jgi:23S rRNA (guanosine2251-2'-O)-methyltransferase